MRVCRSCGSRASETPFPKKGLNCCDCQAEAELAPRPETTRLTTRASYRAALRHRQKSPQLDLVDLVIRCP